ncbi:MAG: class I tRNA ligase family protein [Planctomycetota bacterium]|jgi:isoleucyl-tRNA synthetase
MAPAFGEDDYRIGQENDLPIINLVKPDGTFCDEVEPWKGIFVKDADREIIKALKERKLVLKSEQYLHDYPFCWRCDCALIYYARPTWYVKTTAIKDKMLANNETIDWHPAHIKGGRFGNFLETNIDWALSRERYWGTPLPIWQCQGCPHQTAIGSLKELQAQASSPCGEVELHKPYVDDVLLNCPKCSSTMKRVPEVIDCWFDSGSMPLAQWGYPHADGSNAKMDDMYPAAFITEAIDQTRGWFYSLLAIATLLKECSEEQAKKKQAGELSDEEYDPALERFGTIAYPAPYERCLVLGHVCDEKGYKMSKSKGNYLDPWEILNENGADAMRWHFYSSNQPWVSVRFSKASVRDAQKDFLVRLRNVSQFFTIYANIDGFSPVAEGASVRELTLEAFSDSASYVPCHERSSLDRWIRSKLANTNATVTASLDSMDIHSACKALHDFVDALSNWFVRRSRDRFWKSEKDADKYSAYWTLYECLTQCSLLLTPIVPFFAERLYQDLARHLCPGLPVSVHLHPWPLAVDADRDAALEHQMELVREAASLGLSARAGQKIKVRQPLGEAIVIVANASDQAQIEELQAVICEELNVKTLTFTEEASTYVDYEVKPNFKLLGPKLGKQMGALGKILKGLDAAALCSQVNQGTPVEVELNGEPLSLLPEELDVRVSAKEGYVAAQGPKTVVVLDTMVTDALAQEGLAREVINRIQGLRKEMDLAYESRIHVRLECSEGLQTAVDKHREMIQQETLATEIQFGDVDSTGSTKTLTTEVEKSPLTLSIEPV